VAMRIEVKIIDRQEMYFMMLTIISLIQVQGKMLVIMLALIIIILIIINNDVNNYIHNSINNNMNNNI
jgi:hypothetical protein